jgi:thioredoxin-like negative regulator of GroEL
VPVEAKKPRGKRWLLWFLVPVAIACLCLAAGAVRRSIVDARATAQARKSGELQATPTTGVVEPGNEEINNARRRVDENPNDPYPRLELAVALYRDGQIAQAEQTYRDALSLGGQDGQFFAKAGEKWTSLGNWIWAVMAYQRMVKYMPQPIPEDLVNLWHEAVYRAYKDPKTPQFLPIVSIEEVDPVMAGIARARNSLANDQLDQAGEAINAVFAVVPNLADARLVFAELLLRRGKIDQARQELEKLKGDSQLPAWIRDVAKQIFEEKILKQP